MESNETMINSIDLSTAEIYYPQPTHPYGVTTFKYASKEVNERIVIAILAQFDTV
jgi:hypothetical protein